MAMTNEARKLARQRKAEQGLCTLEGCQEPRVVGKTKCQPHLDRDAANARKRNEQSIAAGKCPRCKKRPPETERIYCRPCLNECNELNKTNYRKDPSKQQAAAAKWRADKLAAGLCTQCGEKPPREGREHCLDCAETKSTQGQQRRTEQRRLVFEHYGTACICCGQNIFEFLEIDHIDGGGAAHRKEIGQGGLYRWLIANGYPSGFQVLCSDCNHAKGRYGACPHQSRGLPTVAALRELLHTAGWFVNHFWEETKDPTQRAQAMEIMDEIEKATGKRI